MFQSRKFYYTLFVLGALYVLLVQQFFQNESRFLINSPKYTRETSYSFTADFQELNLQINKETIIHGVWFKHENSKGLVLLFPDADVDISLIEINKNHYYRNGFDVLITAYRGTASSLGKLKRESDLFSDAQHWYNFAKSQFSEDEIILAGDRFGASIAAQLAGNNSTETLILENPYYSYSDYISKSKFWWLPYSYFTSFKLNTWEYVRKTTSEIILIQEETKKSEENCLSKYIKQSDKTYWVYKPKNISNHFHPENSLLFEEILNPLLPSIKPE